jgi:hypothetical protein
MEWIGRGGMYWNDFGIDARDAPQELGWSGNGIRDPTGLKLWRWRSGGRNRRVDGIRGGWLE